MVKILKNTTFKKLIQLLSEILYIDHRQTNIELSMKLRNIDNNRLVNIKNDWDVDCLSGFSILFIKCVLVFVKTSCKFVHAST